VRAKHSAAAGGRQRSHLHPRGQIAGQKPRGFIIFYPQGTDHRPRRKPIPADREANTATLPLDGVGITKLSLEDAAALACVQRDHRASNLPTAPPSKWRSIARDKLESPISSNFERGHPEAARSTSLDRAVTAALQQWPRFAWEVEADSQASATR